MTRNRYDQGNDRKVTWFEKGKQGLPQRVTSRTLPLRTRTSLLRVLFGCFIKPSILSLSFLRLVSMSEVVSGLSRTTRVPGRIPLSDRRKR